MGHSMKQDQIDALPVIELELLSRYRVDAACQCANEDNREILLSQEQVEEGAARGCATCVYTYNMYEFHQSRHHTASFKFRNHHGRERRRPFSRGLDIDGQLQLDCFTVGAGSTASKADFYGKEVLVPSNYRNYPTGTDLAGKARITQAWMKECLEKHGRCAGVSLPTLPTRVLDLTAVQTTKTVRLHESHGERREYACLSHCWGDSNANKVLRTVSETLPRFVNEIQWSLLPRTFRDAIDFTVALGIKFLWIDSLCIVQDDPADWNREAANMADTYANCALSIAAFTSPHADGRLFPEDDQLFKPVKFACLKTVDGETRPIYTRWAEQHRLEDQPILYPLSSRAWVFQERLLAPRTVYFLGSEIGWECRERTDCECCEGLRAVSTKKIFWDHCTGRSNERKSVRSYWKHIVSTYSRLCLSFGEDTLPALHGLAKQWAAAHPDDEYIAGLWRNNLLEELLWISETLRGRARRWRAPSWSWASLDSPGLAFLRTHARLWHVEHVSMSYKASDTDLTGALSSASLTLRGRMVEGALIADLASRSKRGSIRCLAGFDFLDSSFWPDTQWWEEGDSFVAPGSTVKVLLAAFEPYTRVSICLVLRPLDVAQCTYERVGIMHYRIQDVCGTTGKHKQFEVERAFTEPQTGGKDAPRRARIRADVSKNANLHFEQHWRDVPILEFTIL